MNIIIDSARCIRCKTCQTLCPTRPSVFDIDGEKAVANPEKCINCKVCVTQCPVQAITIDQQ